MSASKNSTSSKNSSEKQCNSNSDVSSPSNSTKTLTSNEKKSVKTDEKDASEETDENSKPTNSQLDTQSAKKRSSTTSSSSSVSSNSNTSSVDPSSSKELNESVYSAKALNSKKLETTPDTAEKLTTAKLTLKTRNSDSISSNCSTYSIKRPSIDDKMLLTGDKDDNVAPDLRGEDIKVDTVDYVTNETKIEHINTLLSIKEEIMDFEPTNNIIVTTNVIANPSPNTPTYDLVETRKEETTKADECEVVTPKTPTTSTKSSKVTLKRNSAKATTTKKEEINIVHPVTVIITNEESVSKNDTSSKCSSKIINEEKQVESVLTEKDKKIETNMKSIEKPSDLLVKHDTQSVINETKIIEGLKNISCFF